MILMIIFWGVLCLLIKVVVWICVIEVDVRGVCEKLLNNLLILLIFSVFLISCWVSLFLNGLIWFWSNVSFNVILWGSKLWCVDSICLNLIYIGLSFCKVSWRCILVGLFLCWLCN